MLNIKIYDSENEDDKIEYAIDTQASAMYSALFEIKNHLREYYKRGMNLNFINESEIDKEYYKEGIAKEVIDKIYEEVCSLMSDVKLDF